MSVNHTVLDFFLDFKTKSLKRSPSDWRGINISLAAKICKEFLFLQGFIFRILTSLQFAKGSCDGFVPAGLLMVDQNDSFQQRRSRRVRHRS